MPSLSLEEERKITHLPALRAMRTLFEKLYPTKKDSWPTRVAYAPGFGLTVTPPKGAKEMFTPTKLMLEAQRTGIDLLDAFYVARQRVPSLVGVAPWKDELKTSDAVRGREEETILQHPACIPAFMEEEGISLPILAPAKIEGRIHNLAAAIRKAAGGKDPLILEGAAKVSPLTQALIEQHLDHTLATAAGLDLAKRAQFKQSLADGFSGQLIAQFTRAILGALLATYIRTVSLHEWNNGAMEGAWTLPLPPDDKSKWVAWNDEVMLKLVSVSQSIFTSTLNLWEPMALIYSTEVVDGKRLRITKPLGINLLGAYEFINHNTGEVSTSAGSLHQIVSHAMTCSSLAALTRSQFALFWPAVVTGSSKTQLIALSRLILQGQGNILGAYCTGASTSATGHPSDDTALGELGRCMLESLVQETNIYKQAPTKEMRLLGSLKNIQLPPEFDWTGHKRTSIFDVATFQAEQLLDPASTSWALNTLEPVNELENLMGAVTVDDLENN